jgi:hypothetical protein
MSEQPRKRYEYVRKMIQGAMGQHSPPVVGKEQQARLKACDTGGEVTVEEFDSALAAMDRNNDIALGAGYVCWPADRQMLVEAIEYVGDSEFVASANQVLQSEVFDDE